MFIDLHASRRLARGYKDLAKLETDCAARLPTDSAGRTPHLTLASACLTASTAILDLCDVLEARGDERQRNT